VDAAAGKRDAVHVNRFGASGSAAGGGAPGVTPPAGKWSSSIVSRSRRSIDERRDCCGCQHAPLRQLPGHLLVLWM
jgi:hypothetical protein